MLAIISTVCSESRIQQKRCRFESIIQIRGLLSGFATEDLQAVVARTIMADAFNDHTFTQLVPDTFQRLSNDEAITIYKELEHLRELCEWLGHDGPSKDLHRKIWVNTQICKVHEEDMNLGVSVSI